MMLYSDDDSRFHLQVHAYSFGRNPDTYLIRMLVSGFDERRRSLDVIEYPLVIVVKEKSI